jgi:hypothetical protein
LLKKTKTEYIKANKNFNNLKKYKADIIIEKRGVPIKDGFFNYYILEIKNLYDEVDPNK